jgi:NAD-dependent SIR2 family protein deacetylase
MKGMCYGEGHDGHEEQRHDSDRLEESALQLLSSESCFILTGAGMSTDSGIPDYRGPESIKKKRNPIQHKEFVGQEEARRRYWARSSIGWPLVRDAAPNNGHFALAEIERMGGVSGIVTQNVDGLHQAAGSRDVVELHGSLYDVRCLSCGRHESRESVQQRLFRLNPEWSAQSDEIAPDGDVELPEGLEQRFRVPSCRHCGGVLKPDVVFFGDTVPKERVEEAWRRYYAAGCVFVVGSSLTVFSGYRFVKAAAKEGKPVLIVNGGPTRGDAEADVKIDGRIAEVLTRLLRGLQRDGERHGEIPEAQRPRV